LLPSFASNPTEAVLFAAGCLIWLIPELIGMLRQWAKVSRQTALIQDRGSLTILVGLQWVGLVLNFALAWLAPGAAIHWQRSALFLLGVALIPLGVALRWYAIRTLGQYFTRDVAVSADQPVVAHGPYRLIRHPAYSGTFLTMLGVGLAMTNWASLFSLMVCVFIGHLYRVMVEEKVLIHALGQPYMDYMRRTRRFIPLLF
jgi:protein-S-isoprenylcysteine O-methyltransferase Ste14